MVKLKISFLVAILLHCNHCLANGPNLKDTMDWLKKTIPQCTVEDRSDDFNCFFKEDTEYSPPTSPSFWELSYDAENLCKVTATLKDMRKYDFTLSDVVSIFPKQRGEYIKLIIKTEKDKVKVEQSNNWDENPEFIPEVSKTDLVVIDFPLYSKRVAIQVVRALEHAVSLCTGKEVLLNQ